MANEYERNTLSCDIRGTVESVSNEQVLLPRRIKLEISTVSIRGSTEILKIKDIKASTNNWDESKKEFNYVDLKNVMLKNISIEKVGLYNPSQFDITLTNLPKFYVSLLLEELGAKDVPDLQKSNLIGPLHLSNLTNSRDRKIQIHFPVGDEFDGLSYHIFMKCYDVIL